MGMCFMEKGFRMEKSMENIKKIAQSAVELMKSKGADKGQVFVTEGEERELNIENGQCNLLRTMFDQDINILIYKNQKKGSYYVNKLDEDSVENAVSMAIKSSEDGMEDEAYDIAPYEGVIESNKGIYEPDMEKLFARVEELMAEIKEKHPLIMVQKSLFGHSRRHMTYSNTNGTFCEEYRGYYWINLNFAGNKGDVTTGVIYSGFLTNNLDKPFIDQGDIKVQLEIAEKQLDAKPTDGKFTGIMMLMPNCTQQFVYFAEALVNNDPILNKNSIWLDKIGKQVADSRITIKIDPNDVRIINGETISFDGFKSKAYDFIKEGKLENFIIDYYVSKKTGYKKSANGGNNTIIEPGEESYKDMIKRIKKGILVNGFSGGQPGINGEFSGVAKNSFIIENGEITGAVSETMISGNIADMLMKLEGVSSETLCDGYSVCPYMAFDGITVSGK